MARGTRKKFEDLTFTDDFMFVKIMSTNLDLCRELLEMILNTEIEKVELAEPQKTINITGEKNIIFLA